MLKKKQWKLIQTDGLKGGSWIIDQPRDVEATDAPEKETWNSEHSDSDESVILLEESDAVNVRNQNAAAEHNESSDDITVIEGSTSENTVRILDPEIAKCSKTVLTLNSERDDVTSDQLESSDPSCHLKLLPEEALFLSYALGCLIVSCKTTNSKSSTGRKTSSAARKESSHEMSIDEMWTVFSKDDPKFPIKYAVYHHYRTRGWVVKSGLKFGADWGE